jgi:hypothetical protein
VGAAGAAAVAPQRLTRSGKRADRVTVRNRGRRTTTFYVTVGFAKDKRLKLLNAAYALRVTG